VSSRSLLGKVVHMAALVSYLLALLATAATVAWALRGGRRAPEGAVVAYGIILVGWWAVIYLAWLALR
jgi:hypothetical protein